MNCRQFEQFLDQYLDGELEGTLKLEFEAHLVDCESCGHEFAVMEAVGEIISAPAPDEPRVSVNFADRVMADLSAQKQVRVKFRRVMAKASLAAAAMLILTGTVIFSSARFGKNAPANTNQPLLASWSQDVGNRSRESRGVSDLVAETIEQAGSTLWEIKELKATAVDQVRQGLIKSFAGPSVTPIRYPVSVEPAVLDKANRPSPAAPEAVSEPEIEML